MDLVLVLVLVLDLDLDRDLHGSQSMNFRKLEVYQFAIRFLPIAAELAGRFSQQHAELADQIRRASVSIPLNIAEGSGKTTGPDQRRFYAIARGSAMECGAIVDACVSLKILDPSEAKHADDILSSVVRMLSKMCRD